MVPSVSWLQVETCPDRGPALRMSLDFEGDGIWRTCLSSDSRSWTTAAVGLLTRPVGRRGHHREGWEDLMRVQMECLWGHAAIGDDEEGM